MRPERIVHLGLGAFFRAHQAWYTEHATDSASWGIVAYTGRSPQLAQTLSSQGNRYTLITRTESRDSFEVIGSVVRSEAGTNLEDLLKTIAKPEIAIITLTITEAGYRVTDLPLTETILGRLSLGLEARRQKGSKPLAIISCDNMPSNGTVLKQALLTLGEQIGDDYLEYLAKNSFVHTSVDRITPRLQPEDYQTALTGTGFNDQSPVVTEEFSDWVLSGEFPLGRPNWESAGAKFVSEIDSFENRKLWLLNGAHSLLATYGTLLGLETVDEAIAHPELLAAVKNWFSDASNQLTAPGLELDRYTQQLLQRFENPRIGYQLSQIATDSLTKFTVRVAPVALAELNQNRMPTGAVTALASYLAYLQLGHQIQDSRSSELEKALSSESDTDQTIMNLISPELANNSEFMKAIKTKTADLMSLETKSI